LSRWGQGVGPTGACGKHVASHRLVSRRFLLPRPGKSHVQSRDRTGGAALFTFQLRSGHPRRRRGARMRRISIKCSARRSVDPTNGTSLGASHLWQRIWTCSGRVHRE
jgi:hypothetical protein